MVKTETNPNKSKNSLLQKFSMAVLATLPMSAWYAIPFPTGLGLAIVLFSSGFVIVKNHFQINIVPNTFWIVFIYVCFMWMYNNHFAITTIIPPGGWNFFLFFLALIWGILTFDINLLKRYMRWIVWISMGLFWIQFILLYAYGSNIICFVPNLTGSFTYEDLTYAELVQKHHNGIRPCSIFIEPSYMAYYYITYLALIWFEGRLKTKWINTEIILIIVLLIALKSGSGMVGLAILTIVKFFMIFGVASTRKQITIILILLPLIAGSIFIYTKTNMGQEMLSRSDELSTANSSGFNRVIGGILMFEQLNKREQIIGIGDPRSRFEVLQSDGTYSFYVNGFQTILLSLGYIGTALYILFYASVFRKVNLSSRMCIIVLLILSLIESNYLNPYMILLTIIPCADYYKRNFKKKHENSLYIHSFVC